MSKAVEAFSHVSYGGSRRHGEGQGFFSLSRSPSLAHLGLGLSLEDTV